MTVKFAIRSRDEKIESLKLVQMNADDVTSKHASNRISVKKLILVFRQGLSFRS